MDIREIIALLKEDFSFGQHKFDDLHKRYLKIAKGYSHRKDRVDFNPVSFKSATGFNYVFRFYKRAANDSREGKIDCEHYIWFIKRRGLFAIRIVNQKSIYRTERKYQVYIPHFFDRYRERFLKDISIPKLEVMRCFMLCNPQGALMCFPSEKYPDSVWARCNDGLILSNQVTDEIYECKTYISFDMTFSGERRFVDLTAEEGLKRGFEFKLPEENFYEYLED